MKKNWVQIILIFAFIVHPVFLIGQNRILNKVFTKKEQVTICKIINFYDSTVLARTNHKYDIKEAYYHYFDSIFPIVMKSGDLSPITVSKDKRIKFLSSLNQKVLGEIYVISDTVTWIIHGKREKRYSPYTLECNCSGKYATLLKELSKKNSFIREYYTSMRVVGDFSPSDYAMILREYKKLNFGNKLHRLLIIINLLAIG